MVEVQEMGRAYSGEVCLSLWQAQHRREGVSAIRSVLLQDVQWCVYKLPMLIRCSFIWLLLHHKNYDSLGYCFNCAISVSILTLSNALQYHSLCNTPSNGSVIV